LFGHDLRKGRKVALPLRADARGYVDATTGLDGDARALVGAHAGGLDKGDDADAHVTALGAQAGLFFLDELVVADHVGGLFEHRRIVPAVEHQGRKGLVNDLVIVGKGLGRQKVSLAYLDPVYAQFFGRHV
jgi:hypothetical protein